jgi:hypothetical protein
VTLLAFAACKGGGGETGSVDAGADIGGDPGSSLPARYSPRVLVVDEAGKPLAGVRVRVGERQYPTKDDGIAVLAEQASDVPVMATIATDKHAPTVRRLTYANASVPRRVPMRATVTRTVDANVGGLVRIGRVRVELPGRSFIKANGAPYDGEVTVAVASLEGSDDEVGGDRLTDSPWGMMRARPLAHVFVDLKADDGSKVAFAPGQRVRVSAYLPTRAGMKVGDEVGMYGLNPATSILEEQSSCKVALAREAQGDENLICEGEVEHFSDVWLISLNRIQAYCYTITSGSPIHEATLTSPETGSVAGHLPLGAVKNPAGGEQGFAGLLLTLGDVDVSQGGYELWIYRGGWLNAKKLDTLGQPLQKMPEGADFFDPAKCLQISVAAEQPGNGGNVDEDQDGFTGARDCNDKDASIHVGAHRVCDGKDHDCDGKVDDEEVLGQLSALSDRSWDILCPRTKLTCSSALKTEVPKNGRDEDCDGVASDLDEDDFLEAGDPLLPAGTAADCDDSNPAAFPGMPAGREKPGNDVDEDCDGVLSDVDGDTFPSVRELVHGNMSLYVSAADCNDYDASVHPGLENKDTAVLTRHYQDGKRLDSFCTLFNEDGSPTAKLQYLLLIADRNCNGYLEDLDGDGYNVEFAGDFKNVGPFDSNDLDPRVYPGSTTVPSGDPACAGTPDLTYFGEGERTVCPRLFNQQQLCVEAQSQQMMGTGEFLCALPDYKDFQVPPNPLGFQSQYGPCSTQVLSRCSVDASTKKDTSLCGGPITFSSSYVEALKKHNYDVAKESFTGFCMPVCSMVTR